MPATSHAALLNFQANLEAGFAAYFSANGITAYHSRSTSDMVDERVILAVEVGAAQGHCAPAATSNTGWQEEDWFAFTLKAYVQTDRAKGTASPDSAITLYHDYLVARVKTLCLRGAMKGLIAGITGLSLDWYIIPVLTYSGDNYDVDENALDTTEITYAGQLQILASAWPESGD